MIRIGAGKFKDQCLKILDQVAETRNPVVVTKRGRPIATVIPFSASPDAQNRLAGSVLAEHGDPFGTGEDWDADRS
jgi:prevent-host-death family protein